MMRRDAIVCGLIAVVTLALVVALARLLEVVAMWLVMLCVVVQ